MVFILIKYIKLLKELASSVLNDKILLFSIQVPKNELTTSHVPNAKNFGMNEQYRFTKTIWNKC